MNFSDFLTSLKKDKGATKSHMKNLIEMAAADGNFSDVEFSLLKDIAKDHGISESHLKTIKQDPSAVQFEMPKDENEKFKQLFDLVHMMSIDNEVHPNEVELCTLFAIKFGYERKHVKELLDLIRANIKNGSTVDETRKRASMIIGH
jgi:uncharacterized tellurite resistance protein B-like protein